MEFEIGDSRQQALFDSSISRASFLAAIAEMARVLRRGGQLLIANLNGFLTAGFELEWSTDEHGKKRHFRIDDYLRERSTWMEYRSVRVLNHHRPLSTYMKLLLEQGLQLTHFDEPTPTAAAPTSQAEDYVRVPWFLVMAWQKF